VSISRPGKIQVRGDAEHLRHLVRRFPIPPMEVAERFIASLAALNAEPLVLPPLLYFHSYRKVQEGNPEIGMMVESERYHRRSRFGPEMQFPISTFKIEVLRSMMRRANLFEEFEREGDDTSSEEVFSTLNGLVERYAGGTIEKLRPSSDSTLDFRVTPTSGGKSFTFDGLSSGQKEIISTLFLIWRYTLHRPGIVLIDEPELHLNVEWHRGCVQQLHELAPANQYIVATHSEEVFASVQADRRRLLEVPETVTR